METNSHTPACSVSLHPFRTRAGLLKIRVRIAPPGAKPAYRTYNIDRPLELLIADALRSTGQPRGWVRGALLALPAPPNPASPAKTDRSA